MSDVHDATYYGKCMIGGIFACGLTHAAVCPLDIVKCRMQVSHEQKMSFHCVHALSEWQRCFLQLSSSMLIA